MFYKFFDKKTTDSGVNIPLKFNEQLAKELHKPIIRNFEKRIVYSGFKDHIWGAYLADMQLISKYNKGFRFLLCLLIFLVNMFWFKDHIWGADLADMQLISKFIKGFTFLSCVIDIFSKYVWVVPLKDKKGLSIVDAFEKILDDTKRKPNKIWVDKGSAFYNNSLKKWLKDNDIETYLIHNEGKSVVAERFITTLKTKI